MDSKTHYSNYEIADIHFIYGFCNGNASAAAREYRRRYPTRRAPTYKMFQNIHRRISEHGISSSSHSLRLPARLSTTTQEMVLNEFTRNPGTSIRRVSAQLGISKSSVERILQSEGLHAYHYRRVQNLNEPDFRSRAIFCSWILTKIRNDPDFTAKIMWTDEATFTRAGITNFRNLHIWAEENPHAIRPSRFQQQFSVNVWAAIINDELVGPVELPQVMNSLNFLNFLQNEFSDLLDDLPLATRRKMWLQLDGCPSHFGINVRQYLNENFPQWIGRGGLVSWPPRSPDLTPLDFFLWGTMKEKVYATVVETRQELLERIKIVANEIRATPGLIKRTTQSVGLRATACIQNRGGHFENWLS